MIVSTKGRYALRVMIDLAQHDPAEFVPLKDITQRLNMSNKYVEAILGTLVKAGFVDGQRGKGGGYRLTKAPADYTAAAILELTEKSLAPVTCVEKGATACENAAACPTCWMWLGLDRQIQTYLLGITLADLAADKPPANLV